MQMFLWPGNQFGAQNQVVVIGLGSFDSSWARYSPAPTVAGTTGTFFNAGNGCVAADYAGAPAGDWIAVVTETSVTVTGGAASGVTAASAAVGATSTPNAMAPATTKAERRFLLAPPRTRRSPDI